MPLSTEHKQRSRQSILNSAFKLFTTDGFENTSIDQVMGDAGMTRGAFYAHFSSKSDLYKEAIVNAAKSSRLLQDKPAHLDDKQWIGKLLDGYLSFHHIAQDDDSHGQRPCPLAFLATDIATRQVAVRKTFTHVYNNMNKLILDYTKTFSDCDEDKMQAVTALMIGAVAIGRAVDDRAVAEKILENCKSVVQTLIDIEN